MSDELEFRNVAVIGAGTMGAGIALLCARTGSDVTLQDVTDEVIERGMEHIRAFLEKGIERGKLTAADRDLALARLRTTLDTDVVVRDADLVIEAIPEDVELKNSLFKKVGSTCSETAVLATNTSSLSLAKVFDGVPHPERCVGTHFFNPPPIMPLLELIRTEQVPAEVLDRVERYARQLGKEPIVVADSPGFATSRLGVCLGLEAIRMVQDGVAAPADIDKAMELGYRHPMGPLRLTDLVGLDVRMAIADYLQRELSSPAFEVPELMRKMVAEGKLGKKSGQGFYAWE